MTTATNTTLNLTSTGQVCALISRTPNTLYRLAEELGLHPELVLNDVKYWNELSVQQLMDHVKVRELKR